ncbi:MAG: hypothetical protein LBQ09_08365 [Acidobacteriaceae bacterium]|jgi:sugar lactone lactonase YvrE|nr:hypothetical protein [Acidobacteriaceae bacterium]
MNADQPAPIPPVNDAPNPYNTVTGFFKLPAGREWGSTSAVDVDKDGRSIWVAERCGGNSCLDAATNEIKDIPTVLKFDQNGNLVTSFGNKLIIFPHGIHVDRDGNIWITDGQDNAPRPQRGAGGAAGGGAGRGGAAGAGGGAAAAAGGGAGGGAGRGAAAPAAPGPGAGATKGHQVFKFSPDGKLLLTIGKPGGSVAPGECCFQPNDVITTPDGRFIFIAEGHASTPGWTAKVMKFDATGKFISEFGKWGAGDGEFDQPHALAFDSQGRLFVGDRNNNRVQVFDQNGKFLDKMYEWSRPSGIYIDKNDILYVADSESKSVSRNHQDWKRGIRIGSIKDRKITAFIPDPEENATNTSAAEGVVVDAAGNVYGAEVGPRQVKKYTKK